MPILATFKITLRLCTSFHHWVICFRFKYLPRLPNQISELSITQVLKITQTMLKQLLTLFKLDNESQYLNISQIQHSRIFRQSWKKPNVILKTVLVYSHCPLYPCFNVALLLISSSWCLGRKFSPPLPQSFIDQY